MKRSRLPIDTRLNWRSPAMPVLRDYTMRDGSHPDYKHDPTYHMRKDKPQ